jgi:hypothetical protein
MKIIRTIIPFILANLGITFIALAVYMPVFEWQISQVVTNFPSTYEVNIPPSPLRTGLGDSLDDKSFVFQRLRVSVDSQYCSAGNMNSVVDRSWNEAILERVLLWLNINYRSLPWLLRWGLIELVLAGIFIWWSTIYHEGRPISDAINSSLLAAIFAAMFFYYFQIGVLRIMGPRLDFGIVDDCQGTLAFRAQLAKIHYETLIVLFVGVLAEIGAFGIMLRQVILAVRKRSAKSVVG